MITVRPAKFKELETIVDFQLKMARETEGLELDPKELYSGVEAVFEDYNKGIYYVAEENEEVVASLLTTPEWSEWRNGTVLWIQSVYVTKDYRGKGVFRAMYSAIKQMVEHKSDLKGIRLYVEKNNLNAQKVYQAIDMNGDHYQLFEWMKDF